MGLCTSCMRGQARIRPEAIKLVRCDSGIRQGLDITASLPTGLPTTPRMLRSGLNSRFLLIPLETCSSPAVQLVIGLDKSGKSQIVQTLQGQEHGASDVLHATMGLSAPAFIDIKDQVVQLNDVGGGPGIRSIWPEFLPEAHGVVFVVDSTDGQRLHEACEMLRTVMALPTCKHKPVLIFANKQDLPGAASTADVHGAMQLPPEHSQWCALAATACQAMVLPLHHQSPHTRIAHFTTSRVARMVLDARRFKVLPSSGLINSDGTPDTRLLDGLHWLSDCIRTNFVELDLRVRRDQEKYLRDEAEKKQARLQRARAAREARQLEKVGTCLV
jgi:ADP-ribosylation factor-like protein 13B